MDTADAAERGEDGSGGIIEAGRALGTSGTDLHAYLSVAMMVLLGSFTAAAAKVAVRDLPVSVVPIVRFGIAGLCLVPLVWGRGSIRRLIREDGWLLILAAALSVPVNQGFFLNASRFAPTTHVAIFYATVPLIVFMLACVLGQERFNQGRLWGVLASIAGVAVIALGNLWGPSSPLAKGAGASSTSAILWGDLLLVGAVASWGSYVTLSKPLVARHGAVPVLVGTFLIGALLDVPVALATHGGWSGPAGVSSASWIALALLALVITPLGQVFQNVSLRRLDASQVATFSNGSPVLTVFWGVWFLDEAITAALAVGGLLTLVGILWSTRGEINGRRESEEADRSLGPGQQPDPRTGPVLCSRESIAGLTPARPYSAA
jgi:drug/metabolite transporter (DMT)-like permease